MIPGKFHTATPALMNMATNPVPIPLKPATLPIDRKQFIVNNAICEKWYKYNQKPLHFEGVFDAEAGGVEPHALWDTE